ncbi:MAG: hypothetical protein J0I95_08285, partial [Microbacterium sp.]|nr:hypothetical protein [Microbacterium sp.]
MRRDVATRNGTDAMTHRRALSPRRLLAAATVAVLAGALASPLSAVALDTDPNDGVPRVDPPVTYMFFEPLADPGLGA